jgi:hypothetical protein
MAQPVFYQTLNMLGVDPTVYYLNIGTAGASITPEFPATPFIPGMQAFGSDGSQFVFVQASTSISLTDFVMINIGPAADPYQANSITTTNVTTSLAVGIGSTGLILKQSVSFIPAGSYFWACTKGQSIPATTSGGTTGLATNTGGVQLFTTSTAGAILSQTVSASLNTAIVGIICINSLTVSIPSSIIPPAGGTQSNGFTVGPVVNINNPRPVNLIQVPATAGGLTQASAGSQAVFGF